ncbi:hypothetical protein KR009_000902 [Drosophila setifemur]|nr:hypothetical protein KR009_000902 [Drosophila setifemur]
MKSARINVRKSCTLNYATERTWEPSYVKSKCKELDLENEYRSYKIRLWKSYLGVFFMLHIFVTLTHCTLLATTCDCLSVVYVDISLYVFSAIVMLSILSINFWDSLIMRRPWIMFATSVLACTIFVTADMTKTLYHNYTNGWRLGSIYERYTVIMVYMFLPIHFLWGAVVLSVIVSMVYTTYFFYFMSRELNLDLSERVSTGSIFIDICDSICIILVGIFIRVMDDAVVRSSFLDRHQFIKEELWLRNARTHEKLLLDSILPPQISKHLQKIIRSRIESKQTLAIYKFNSLESTMVFQIHPDVSILYADVVNYTHLTTTLTVETLVTFLHNLYGRFDRSSSLFGVQRIKFLGDCYYCVAGLTETDPDHAKCCVYLGMDMISHIQEVRYVPYLDINMRIGVHSGTLMAGVIGESKLHLDIWGELNLRRHLGPVPIDFPIFLGVDVTIANVLESTGVPSCVHISSATLSHIDPDHFEIEAGTEAAANHPLLQRYNLHTYIIKSILFMDDIGDYAKQTSLITDISCQKMHFNVHDSDLDQVFQAELHEEFSKMPVSPFNLKSMYSFRRDKKTTVPMYHQINFCLAYNDPEMERIYINQKGYMFKYNMLLAWVIGLGLVAMQLLTVVDTRCIIIDSIVVTILLFLTFIAWYKKLCWWRYKEEYRRYSRFSCFMFALVDRIQASLAARVCIYLLIMTMHGSVILAVLLVCNMDSLHLSIIESKIFHYENLETCFHPWIVTDMVGIYICQSLTFIRIPFIAKTVVAISIATVYLLLVCLHFVIIYHHSTTTNPFFSAEYSHIVLVLFVLLSIYLKERQSEFSSKVNFTWRNDLINKEKIAHLTNQSIIILLNNILPEHVGKICLNYFLFYLVLIHVYAVDVYLYSLASDELYYENYKMVSVMFAKLMNFQTDLKDLRILNTYITEFDLLLLQYREFYVVEKIKVVGCTYMAACGLDLNFARSTSMRTFEGRRTTHDSQLNSDLPRRTTSIISQDFAKKEREEVVLVMATFALDLMRTLSHCLKAYRGFPGIDSNEGSVTIGLSSGEVMAGIVGASQPHYDIWGNSVNMASRMQTTGLPGHIQVTEESAQILKEFGISCTYRGLTAVKGRGNIPTYFVDIDEDLNFIVTEKKREQSFLTRSIANIPSSDLSFGEYKSYDFDDESKDIQE